MPRSKTYTEQVKVLAERAERTLKELSELMKKNGETARAMDVDEAIYALKAATEEF